MSGESQTKPMATNVTIRDIARHCGVSTATVSKVLNKHSNVSAKNRQKVLEAVRKLGYVPSAAARQMRTGRPFDSVSNQYLEIILPDNSYMSLFHMEMIRNLIKEAFDYGFQVVTSLAYQNMQVARAQGIIITTQMDHNFTVPIATADFISPDHAVPSVTFDYRAGALESVRTAFGRGYRNPIFLIGQPDMSQTNFYTMYYEGFSDAVQEFGLDPANHLFGTNAVTAHDGYQFVTSLFDTGRMNYDLVVTTDDAAFGVYHALHEHGVSIPEDVGVLGCDGVPLSEHLTPAVSTIAVDWSELARHVLARLIPLIKKTNGPYPQKLILPTRFVDRGSISR